MAAWRYEISLPVLRTSEIFFQHEKRNFVSPRGHVISSISPRDQKLPAFMSSLASGLVTVDLRLNTSLSIGRRWGFTSTSLQTLLSSNVRIVWMASCLCATKSPLHNRARLTVNRSPRVGSSDPLAMPWYAINTSINSVLYNWYKLFSQEGKKFGYLVNGSKS